MLDHVTDLYLEEFNGFKFEVLLYRSSLEASGKRKCSSEGDAWEVNEELRVARAESQLLHRRWGARSLAASLTRQL